MPCRFFEKFRVGENTPCGERIPVEYSDSTLASSDTQFVRRTNFMSEPILIHS